jgi:hypothetical protein
MQITQIRSKRIASIITGILLLHMVSPICGISLPLKHMLYKSHRNFLTDIFVNVDSQSMFYIHIVYFFICFHTKILKSPVLVGYLVTIAKQTFLKAAILIL